MDEVIFERILPIWTDKDTEARLALIEEEGYNAVGEFEVRLMLKEISRLKERVKELEDKGNGPAEERRDYFS